MNSLVKIFLLSLFLVIYNNSYANTKPIKLVLEDLNSGLMIDQLQKGDSLFIDYSSHSCHHSNSIKIVITKVGKGYKWTKITTNYWGAMSGEEKITIKRQRIKKEALKALQQFEEKATTHKYVKSKENDGPYSGSGGVIRSTLSKKIIRISSSDFYTMLRAVEGKK